MDLVASHSFGPIQGNIRFAQQLLSRTYYSGNHGGGAGTDCHHGTCRGMNVFDTQRLDCKTYLFSQVCHAFSIGIRQNQNELFAPITGNQISGAQELPA
jgi:hypothetical protein